MNKSSCDVVGVVGAGVIGVGVVESIASSGCRVVLVDTTEERLNSARVALRDNLRMSRLFGSKAAIDSPDVVIGRVFLTTSYESLNDVTYVIENVTERWMDKKPVYEILDAICPEECIFAANTSAIPISHIAAATNRADRVIGVHFMNPVPQKSTVEVVRGARTSEQTLETTLSLLRDIGKQGVVVGDGPGFVTNRILMLTINEAIAIVSDQIAQPVDVDRIFKECFGHPMGPLETADLIGLDTILYTLEVLCEFGDSEKFQPNPLLQRMVESGRLGRKSDEGFYKYG